MRPVVTRLIIVALALLISGFAAVRLIGPNGLTAYLEKRKEIGALKTKKAALEHDVSNLRNEKHGLDAKPSKQEIEVRRRLGLLKPDEKLFIFEEQPGQRSPGQNQSPAGNPAAR